MNFLSNSLERREDLYEEMTIRPAKKKNRNILKIKMLIFLIAVSLRLIMLLFSPYNFPEYGDSSRASGLQSDDIRYDQLAYNFLEGKGINISGEQGSETVDFRRPPGMLLWLAGIYKIFGYDPKIAMIFNIIVDSLTSILLIKLSQYFISLKMAIFIGLAYAIYMPAAAISSLLMTEPLQTFCWVSFLLILISIPFFAKKALIFAMSLLVILMAFDAYLKPSNLIIALVFSVLILNFIISKSISLKKGILIFSLGLIAFFLILLPHIFWMKKVYGVFTFMPHWTEHQALFGIRTTERQLFKKNYPIPEHLFTLNLPLKKERIIEEGKQVWAKHQELSYEKRIFFYRYLREKPVHYAIGVLYRFQQVIPRSLIAWRTDFSPLTKRKLIRISSAPLLIMAIIPFILSLIGLTTFILEIKKLWILALCCALIWVPYILTFATDRLGYPAHPFFFIAIFIGCSELISKIKSKSR